MHRHPLREPSDASPPLAQRISAALENDAITSTTIAALFGEVETAIAEAEHAAADANQRALDPTIEDAEAARQQRDDCCFRLERLKAALAPLQARYSQVRLAERKAAWRADYAAVKAKRDSCADKLQSLYELTLQLVEVLEEAKEIDEQVEAVNRGAPANEHDRLLTVECAARQVTSVGVNSVLSLMNELKLPHWSTPGLAWPPPVSPILPEQVIPAAWLRHPGDNWAAHQQAAKEQAAAEAKRVRDYHARQQREQEERVNAQAKAAQARRQAAT
jgi:hypothetical protein